AAEPQHVAVEIESAGAPPAVDRVPRDRVRRAEHDGIVPARRAPGIGTEAHRGCGKAAVRSVRAPMLNEPLPPTLTEVSKEATMRGKKKLTIGTLALATAGILAGSAFGHAPKTITIRHQMRGCHAWSFAGGPYSPSLKVTVDRNTALVFV